MNILSSICILLSVTGIHAFGVKEPVSKLLEQYAGSIATLKEETAKIVGSTDVLPYSNDVFFLRYCLAGWGTEELKESLAWRQGPGKKICESAVAAFQKATEGDKWNNDPVRDAAPHADKINPYITPSTALTTSTSKGDLLYCVRAGFLDDTALLKSVSSSDDLVQFFLYGKEVNNLVANQRSLEKDQMLYIIVVNDLKGVKLIGGDSSFRDALSASSKQGSKVYPAVNGPTLLLNLPALVSVLVKLFTPLFPPDVAKRIKFERGPLNDVEELMDISYGGKKRAEFLADVDRLCY
jgi:hypothetical protein